jgi:phage gpG-like protein
LQQEQGWIMSLTFVDKDLGWKDLQKRIKEFKKAVIKVGVQTNAGLNEDGTPIVKYAAYNEFGTIHEGGNIPERSFIRETAKKYNNWNKEVDEAYTSVIDGKDTPFAAIAKVGIIARDDIKQAITDGIDPENAPATIAKKGSSKTLIDTGALRNSINYKFDDGS